MLWKLFRAKSALNFSLLFAAVAVCVFLMVYLFFYRKSEHQIFITTDGFYPAELSVEIGDKVAFINNSTEQHWPASVPYPTYDFLPSFDLGRALESGERWTLVFSQAGEWRFHDYLFPQNRGVIKVFDGNISEATPDMPDEMSAIVVEKNPAVQAKLVRALAEKYGPKEALAYMNKSGLPYTGETHLLVHEIGDVAYLRYGDDALKFCDESFLSACYHGAVLHAISNKGLGGVKDMLTACRADVPQVFAQCVHATGHGLVAYSDYNLPNALQLCDELTEGDANIPAFNCYDGAFMENIWGVHDGQPSPNRMVKDDDPFFPCNAFPDKYQEGCWANQATLMYQLFGHDLKKVAEHCDMVKNEKYQATCYDNFARQIHPISQGQLKAAIQLCKNATGDWQNRCVFLVGTSAFGVGDRTNLLYETCAYFSEIGAPITEECYAKLLSLIGSFGGTLEERTRYCGFMREPERRKQCLEKFSISPVSESSASAAENFSSPKAFSALVSEIGVQKAYLRLKTEFKDNQPSGHDFAHIIGQRAYEIMGKNGFDTCDTDFAFGCYHGYMEMLFYIKGSGGINEAENGCVSLGVSGRVASCVHGIGHGIMGYEGEINKSLVLCGSISSNRQTYCFDGVFMEYFTGVMDPARSAELINSASPWEFCRQFKNEEEVCVRNLVLLMLQKKSNDNTVATGCVSLPTSRLTEECVLSFGLHTAQISGGAPSTSFERCKNFFDGGWLNICVTAAARELLFEGFSKTRAYELCGYLAKEHRQPCSKELDTMMASYDLSV